MIHHIYNHNYLPWANRMKRINGAFTYSQDICKYYLPVLDETIRKERGESSIVVSTCPPLAKYNPKCILNTNEKYDVLVQFLHSYPYTHFLDVLQNTMNLYKNQFEEIIFVTAYEEYAKIINQFGHGKGVSARFVPMRIGSVPVVRQNPPKQNRAVWFGNIYDDKVSIYKQVTRTCVKAGVELITIEGGKLGGKQITQQAAWQIMSDSGIVFGVGRCALEAYSMGCYVIIAGAKFGGTVITEGDWKIQESTNFNGRLHTGHRTIDEAIYETQYAMASHDMRPKSGTGRILCDLLILENDGLLWV